MRVLEGTEREAIRQALGMVSARADLEKRCEAVVSVELPELGSLGGVLKQLLRIRPVWWLVPKYRYFGDTWSHEQWRTVGLPLLGNHVLEWSAEDLAAIDSIVTSHYWDGCALYLAPTDGTLLAPVAGFRRSGIMGFDVGATRLEEAELLSAHLRAAGIRNEVHTKEPDA